MYKVSIVNGDDEIIINEVSTNKHAPRILGTVKLGINTIDSFTFKIFFDNPGYDKIKPYASIVKVYNTLKNKYETNLADGCKIVRMILGYSSVGRAADC